MYSINISESFNDLSNTLSETTPSPIPINSGGMVIVFEKIERRDNDIVKVWIEGAESIGVTISDAANNHLSCSVAKSISGKRMNQYNSHYFIHTAYETHVHVHVHTNTL